MPQILNNPLSSRFDEALQFASKLHREQARKSTQIPYVSHPLAVSSLVLEHGGTEAQAIAALLHDVVEDCGGSALLPIIEARFGAEIAKIVSACSHSFGNDSKTEWKERRKAHIKHLREADDAVMLVIAADKLHNLTSILNDLRSLGDDLWSRFNAGPEDQMWYYQSIINVLDRRLDNLIVERLKDTLDDVQNEIMQQDYVSSYSGKPPLSGVPVFEQQVIQQVFGRDIEKRGFDFTRIEHFVEGNLQMTMTRATDIGGVLAGAWTLASNETLAKWVTKVYFSGVLDGVEVWRRQAELDAKRPKV